MHVRKKRRAMKGTAGTPRNYETKGDYPGLDRTGARILRWLRQAGVLVAVFMLVLGAYPSGIGHVYALTEARFTPRTTGVEIGDCSYAIWDRGVAAPSVHPDQIVQIGNWPRRVNLDSHLSPTRYVCKSFYQRAKDSNSEFVRDDNLPPNFNTCSRVIADIKAPHRCPNSVSPMSFIVVASKFHCVNDDMRPMGGVK